MPRSRLLVPLAVPLLLLAPAGCGGDESSGGSGGSGGGAGVDAGDAGERPGGDRWREDEESPYCDTWTLAEVEAFVPEPTLIEHSPEGGVFCVFDSTAHVDSGAGTGVVELRITAAEGSADYDRFRDAAEGGSGGGGSAGFGSSQEDDRTYDTFTADGVDFVVAGPDPSGDAVSYAYAALVDGNTWRANVVVPEALDDEAAAREVLGEKAVAFGEYVAQ